jgi:hypothetical protein
MQRFMRGSRNEPQTLHDNPDRIVRLALTNHLVSPTVVLPRGSNRQVSPCDAQVLWNSMIRSGEEASLLSFGESEERGEPSNGGR